jgi:hypothetical protein
MGEENQGNNMSVPGAETAGASGSIVEKTMPEQIAISIRAALDPVVKAFDELRSQQSDFAKKTNRELMRNRLRSEGKEVPSDNSDTENLHGPDNVYESIEEKLTLMSSLPQSLRDTVRDEMRGLPIEIQLKTLRILAKRDASATTAAAPSTAAQAAPSNGRGGAPMGSSSPAVNYPRSQHAFFRMAKASRDVLSKDPNFDPSSLPRIVPEDVNG